MSYMHIDNLYKSQKILLFKDCYAMEKIHGTSAHIKYADGKLSFFSGGANYPGFVALFREDELSERFKAVMLNDLPVIVYGEAYGGKLQGMKDTYGDSLRFVCFEVKIGESFLNVPEAESFVKSLGLEFVPYVKVSTDIKSLDIVLMEPSVQAIRNGCGNDKMREGIVLRPIMEVRLNNGDRVIAKYKNDKFKETATPRPVKGNLGMLTAAQDIAREWVTPERLRHVLTSGEVESKLENTGRVIVLMIEDIVREGAGEITDTPEVRKVIGREVALMFKQTFKGDN